MMRVLTVAGGQLIAEEILTAIKPVIGSGIVARASAFGSLAPKPPEDLVVCVSSRRSEVAQKVDANKLVGIEMVPDSRFFVELAQVPSGETVHIFNNSVNYAKKLVEYCTEVGIRHLQFKFIAYDELERNEIIEYVQEAKYIMGIMTIVGPKGKFQEYRQYLNSGATVIIANRILDSESACALMRWITLHEHQNLASNVQDNTNILSDQIQGISGIVQKMSTSFEREMVAFNQLTEKMGHGTEQLENIRALSGSLTEATENIGNVVDTIKHISSQTNLLALNATIEAARVGEVGRGFAVVAREVGKLAAESQKSTETIHGAIAEIQVVVAKIVPPLKDLSNEMVENQTLFTDMSSTVESQNKDISDILGSLEGINAKSRELMEITKKLAVAR